MRVRVYARMYVRMYARASDCRQIAIGTQDHDHDQDTRPGSGHQRSTRQPEKRRSPANGKTCIYMYDFMR